MAHCYKSGTLALGHALGTWELQIGGSNVLDVKIPRAKVYSS